MQKRFLLILMFTGFFVLSWGQTNLSWKLLADIDFEARFFEKYNQKFLVPIFGKRPKAYEGKEVTISGYIIPVDTEFFVLSKNAYASCFFCGAAGPETIVELQLKPKAVRRYKIDELMTFKGILKLNDTDVDHFSYILAEAEPASR